MIDSFSGKYRFLSNFYPSPKSVGPTLEHDYQAAKCADTGARFMIMAQATPGKAKRAAKKCQIREDWDEVKVNIMRDLLSKKFEDPELARMLDDTGYKVLVEGNTWGDTFWGVCDGKGENVLGNLLMQLRQTLRSAR